MLFNSPVFILFFLPITFFVYFYLNQKRLTEAAKSFLLVASLFFYSWWNVLYLPLILLSIIFNYVLGKQLAFSRLKQKSFTRKSLLTFGVIANLALLGYFKYADFFIENFNAVSGTKIGLLHLALPLAISFYTFQQIAYLVDSYRHETKEYDFLNYAVFVTFFPQLIAGPIVHHKEMMPQFASRWNRVKNYKNIATGLFIFSIGLFKKIVIADSLAPVVANGFDISATLTLFEAWFTSLSYTFQLYFDFSGYTDMAIGAALLFNIRLPQNFDSPYKATSIQDFWRRWHMTLSRFLKDYIYIPLGGNRRGSLRTYGNLMATFLLGGIWHGAGWTFVFWGFLHGVALVVHRLWHSFDVRMPAWMSWFITFNFINLTWIFFRAKEFEDAIKVLKGMAGMTGVVLPSAFASKFAFLEAHGISFGGFVMHIKVSSTFPAGIVLLIAGVLLLKNSNELQSGFQPTLRYFLWSFSAVFSGFLFAAYFNATSEFLYFQF